MGFICLVYPLSWFLFLFYLNYSLETKSTLMNSWTHNIVTLLKNLAKKGYENLILNQIQRTYEELSSKYTNTFMNKNLMKLLKLPKIW